MPKVLITCMHLVRHFEKFRSQYAELGADVIMPPLTGQQFSAAEMAEYIEGVDVVIAGDDFIDARVLDIAKSQGLRAVIKWGIGTDGINKVHANKLGIPVYNTPGVFGDEVADLAISHLLMLARKSHSMDASVKSGGWFKSEGRSLFGLTAGVVGLGSIGQAICRRLPGFGIDVIGYDITDFSLPNVRRADLQELLATSDIVFIACALTPENKHLINAESLANIKKGMYLINVSRGPLVDEIALVKALSEGKIAGAGLDVFENEPLPADAPIRAFADRCTFSTHNGSNTLEAVARINQMTTDIAFDTLDLRAAGFVPNRVA